MSLTVSEIFDFTFQFSQKDKYIPPPDPVYWIRENFIDPVSEHLMVLQEWQGRILKQALQIDQDGYSKYDIVIWSQPKKSGKTTTASAVGAYVAVNVESPNEISCVANDQEQSAGRIFGGMIPTLKRLNWYTPVSTKSQYRDPVCYGPKGTVVKAITTNYEKEAGANQGLSLWSELWAYKGERLTRLWEEMTPPPTRKFSMRWVESYAGFIGENILFQDLYLSVFKDFSEKEIQDRVIKLWNDIPVYEIEEHMLVFWDHAHRMPWQTKKYYDNQRKTLRPNTFTRLHENWWVESRDSFITIDMWNHSTRLSHEIRQTKATYALDASKNNDCTVLVGCIRKDDHVITTDVHVWEAEEGEEIDFRDVEKTILDLHARGLIQLPLRYDQYQCVKMAQDLRAKGIRCEEFKQGTDRLKADTLLYKLYKEGKILNPSHPDLKRHILSSSSKEHEDERIRIIKPGDDEATRSNKKIDAAVAQSMAAYACYTRKSSGWAINTTQDPSPGDPRIE